ncbi:MAG TPA: inositol monophosphatase family protein, partial [Acidimicrobiia bacterium]|nr:inositol monophosphatase family protein [Acidimicrobiia bacterium]
SATLLYSNPVTADVYQNGRAFDALVRRCNRVRTWGDCYGYLLVAGGWADIMCDPIMNPWDIAALVPIVRGAGGVITDWTGGDPVRASSTIATTPALHAEVVAALNP